MEIWLCVLIVTGLSFGLVVVRGAPYVPSKKRDLKIAFRELYPLSKQDVLIDIGAGDGVVLREAIRAGAGRAIGYELNPILVVIGRWLGRSFPQTKIILKDFWSVKLPPDTTVIYTFGDTRDIDKMAQKVANEAERLQKPLYLISYGFRSRRFTPLREVEPFILYRFEPLHTPEA